MYYQRSLALHSEHFNILIFSESSLPRYIIYYFSKAVVGRSFYRFNRKLVLSRKSESFNNFIYLFNERTIHVRSIFHPHSSAILQCDCVGYQNIEFSQAWSIVKNFPFPVSCIHVAFNFQKFRWIIRRSPGKADKNSSSKVQNF